MAKDTWTDKYWDDQWTWEDFLDFFKQDEDYISVGEVQDKLDSLKKIPFITVEHITTGKFNVKG